MDYNEESVLSALLQEIGSAIYSKENERLDALTKAYQRIKSVQKESK